MIKNKELDLLQPDLIKKFRGIIQSGRLSHAYLFAGEFGSFELALYIAKSRFCENKRDQLPCGQCRSCTLIEQGQFTDVKIIEPKGTIIKTDDIRQLMREFSQSGYESSEQVYIIRESEKMHVNAANALLKAIEEPTSASMMILIVSDENLILPTIKSRTQVFRFSKNLTYLSETIEKQGVLKTDSKLLADVLTNLQDVSEFANSKKVIDLLHQVQSFVEALLVDKWQAYLQIPVLINQLSDKKEQDLFWRMLTTSMAQKLDQIAILKWLDKSYQARAMWQSNVSLQNALEYMVIE